MHDLAKQQCGPTLPARVPSGQVRVMEGQVSVRVPPFPGDREPRLEIHRDGNIIRAVDVTCACGEKIRIACDYGPLPDSA